MITRISQLGRWPWWLGASDQSNEADWIWNKSRDYVGEYIWGDHFPVDDPARNYLYLSPGFNYHADDAPENEQHYFICQYKYH